MPTTSGAFVYTGAGKKQRDDADLCTKVRWLAQMLCLKL